MLLIDFRKEMKGEAVYGQEDIDLEMVRHMQRNFEENKHRDFPEQRKRVWEELAKSEIFLSDESNGRVAEDEFETKQRKCISDESNGKNAKDKSEVSGMKRITADLRER